MILLILCLLAANLSTVASEPGPGFPKILWTYWNSDLSSAPITTQICINNMIHYTAVSGWEFRFITPSNLTNFMSEESKASMKKLTEGKNIPLPNLSDVYRTFLLYEHGGMWLDASTLFVRDLGWVEGIADNKLVYNKVSEVPEMIMFTSN
jgi:mannosyltransferase OCH1-like enzyme